MLGHVQYNTASLHSNDTHMTHFLRDLPSAELVFNVCVLYVMLQAYPLIQKWLMSSVHAFGYGGGWVGGTGGRGGCVLLFFSVRGVMVE